ncbi:hypothetical protein COOONC_25382, partial [Cooperia oncophora]
LQIRWLIFSRLVAFRGLRSIGSGDVLLLSEARIIPPYPMTWKNFNSKTWKLHKKTVRLSYARMMIAGSFFSGALDYESQEVQNILIIGLGELFDVLLIDVSYNENRPLMAPVEGFLDSDEIEKMNEVIKKDGTSL